MVDDNKLGLAARKAVMEELGYRVISAATPEDALAVCASQKADLIITDYRMPGMNGTEFIRRIRAVGHVQPVIIISGFVDALGLNEDNTGADVVIQKSAHEVSHMVRAVKNLLKREPGRKPAGSDRPRSPRARRKQA
jgi:CheY-like chemotaxis protein